MLKANPSLVTYHILCMALKHNPPTSIIQFMLDLNPKAAGVPKAGLTPLQVAVQSSSSVDVVRLLVEACPLALVATNPGSYLDPLSYAKRFRADETELIKLLSLPLSYWIQEQQKKKKMAKQRSSRYRTPQSKADGQTKKETDGNDNSKEDEESDDDDKTTAAGNVVPGGDKENSHVTSSPLSSASAARERLSSSFNFCVAQTVPISPVTQPLAKTPPSAVSLMRKQSSMLQGRPIGMSSNAPPPPPPPPPTPASARPIFMNTTPIVQQNQQNQQQHQHQHHQQHYQVTNHHDRQELINVKQLCLAVVKGHKRLARDMRSLQEQDFFARLQEQNEKQFRTQLIALDMKEKAMRTYLRKTEERMQAKFKEQVALALEAVKMKSTRQAAFMSATFPNEEAKEEKKAEDDIRVLQERLRMLTNLVHDRLNRLQGRVQAVEDTVTDQQEGIECHYEHEWGQRYAHFAATTKRMDVESPPKAATTEGGLVAGGGAGCAYIVGLEQTPRTVSTTYSTSSGSSSSSAWSSGGSVSARKNKAKHHLGDAVPQPIVFCTPTPPGGSAADIEDDEVRSLLSEDDLMVYKRNKGKHNHHHIKSSSTTTSRPHLPRWLNFMKEGLLLR